MPRPRTVYRGKRKYGWIITAAASLLVVLIILAVWLFYFLQRYIVYDKEGLRLDLSAQRDSLLQSDLNDEPSGSTVDRPHVDVEIVVEEKDYTAVETTAGTDLQSMQALFVPASGLTENALKYYSGGVGAFNALVLELKGPDGYLHWHSSVSTADSYAVNGALELGNYLPALKEKGIYLVAQLSMLTDAAMAVRNAPIALKNAATGAALTDGDGNYWLDPYSEGTRSYYLALLKELKSLGFDEVLFSDFVCPDSEYLQFSLEMTQTPSPTTALSSLAMWLREQADVLGIKVSVQIESEALRSTETMQGQNPTLLFRVFDRVAVLSDYDHLSSDVAAMAEALGSEDENRAVLIMTDYAPQRESYIVK